MSDSDSDPMITTSEAVTDGVRVQVRARYSPDHSNPRGSEWFFLYEIRISNEGDDTVQLTDRHWIIIDGSGKTEEVEGEGVVGEQPILKPGEGFRYTSGAVIETPVGTMHGTYQMVAEDGREFDATIPRFVLSAPRTLH